MLAERFAEDGIKTLSDFPDLLKQAKEAGIIK